MLRLLRTAPPPPLLSINRYVSFPVISRRSISHLPLLSVVSECSPTHNGRLDFHTWPTPQVCTSTCWFLRESNSFCIVVLPFGLILSYRNDVFFLYVRNIAYWKYTSQKFSCGTGYYHVDQILPCVKCCHAKLNVYKWKHTFGGFIKGILRGVRCTKSLRVLFLHRRPPSWTTLVLYSRAVFIFNEPAYYVVKDHVSKWDKMFHLNNIMHMRPNVTIFDHMLSMLSCRNV